MAPDDVAKPPNLPPYPEMILTAIDALNEEGVSNKSAISRQIELTHGEALPEAHSSLLAAHLERMKESGELVFLKNNYFRSGPDAPLKRGRGRPPKPKTDLPSGATPAAGSPRPRGRPPKPKDPLAIAIAQASSGLPKRRGRPPKTADSVRPAAAVPAAAAGAPAVTRVKRGRGRPPKAKPALATEAA